MPSGLDFSAVKSCVIFVLQINVQSMIVQHKSTRSHELYDFLLNYNFISKVMEADTVLVFLKIYFIIGGLLLSHFFTCARARGAGLSRTSSNTATCPI